MDWTKVSSIKWMNFYQLFSEKDRARAEANSTKGKILGLSDFIGRKESIMGTQSRFGSRFSWRSKSIASKGPLYSPGTPKSQVHFSPNSHLGRNGSLNIRKSVDLSLREEFLFTVFDCNTFHDVVIKVRVKNSTKERLIQRVHRNHWMCSGDPNFTVEVHIIFELLLVYWQIY